MTSNKMLYDKFSSAVESIVRFHFGLALILGSTVLSSFTLMMLWNWFAVPLGVHALTLLWAYGLNLIVSFFTLPNRPKIDRMSVEWVWSSTKSQLSASIAVLALGYLTHCLMGM